jgi:pyruvate dehydrogenase E2 component (dihydrolipoamide acetyltransferase)
MSLLLRIGPLAKASSRRLSSFALGGGSSASLLVARPLSSSSSGGGILMPSARHIAETRGFNATGLAGSGKGGRVTKGDVLAALASGNGMPLLVKTPSVVAAVAATPSPSTTTVSAATPPPPPPLPLGDLQVPEIFASEGNAYEDVTNNKMRKVIAKRLTQSKQQVPHFYTSIQVQLDAVLSLRKQLEKQHNVKVSVNDFILRSSALALRDVPQVNASFSEKTNSIQANASVDVAVAVATPTGLITPIIFRTHELGLSEITTTVRDLAARARDGKLTPGEYQGGTFSVSNLGMFGIDEFSAVINPPQAAILAVGGGSKRIIPTPFNENDAAAGNKKSPPTVQTIMTARLSADRRVVDEATASLFMSTFQHYMSKPELLML